MCLLVKERGYVQNVLTLQVGYKLSTCSGTNYTPNIKAHRGSGVHKLEDMTQGSNSSLGWVVDECLDSLGRSHVTISMMPSITRTR